MPDVQLDIEKYERGSILSVTVGGRPVRIRSNETWGFELNSEMVGEFSTENFYRLFMLGIWYRGVGGSVLRAHKMPLYDTIRFPAWHVPREDRLFVRPVGQSCAHIASRPKTLVDTNMICAAQLPTPQEFDLWAFQAEMNLNGPVRERIEYLQNTSWRWTFGYEIWGQGVLSEIPCESTLKDPEIREEYAVEPEVDEFRQMEIADE